MSVVRDTEKVGSEQRQVHQSRLYKVDGVAICGSGRSHGESGIAAYRLGHVVVRITNSRGLADM